MCEKVYQEMELRRGPWTLEEDTLLIHYIACHGEGRWNLLARCSGLRRTGKSCRLRWLNYLKPDIKRGNLSPEEQLLILELHCKWGNRWSRIAQYLPGRTDNEIKNYWRTRVQKQARQLRVDANSATFRDAVRCYWMPRLLQKSCGNWAAASAYTDDHHQSRYNYTPLQPSALPLPEEEQVLMFQCQRLENTTTSCAANAGASFSQSLPVNCLPQFSSEVVDSPGGDSSILPAAAAAAAGIELNQYSQIPFHSTSASSCYDIAATAPVSTAISYSSSSSPSSSLISHPATNCTTTSSSVVDHDGLWSNMDQELYAMLNSYMDGVEYANMFPLGDVPLRDELT